MALTCPDCGAQAAPQERFCENCGAALSPPSPAVAPGAAEDGEEGAPPDAEPDETGAHGGTLLDDASNDATDAARYSPILTDDADLDAMPTACAACSAVVAPDGYCEQCGAAAPRRRDHWVDAPATWLAAVCDRGVRHTRNEDAMAVAAVSIPSSLGALVVCDGVSMAPGSDAASLSAARAARDAMITGLLPQLFREAGAAGVPQASGATDGEDVGAGRPGGTAQQTARAGELKARVVAGGAAAQQEAAAEGEGVREGKSPPSCTFVAALVEGRGPGGGPGVLVAGWVGDSRAYWVPDDGGAVQVSQDDSWAAEAMSQGLPREEAESMPQSHAITRWLGADAPDAVPHTAVVALDRPGWVLLCSDGLWNYASDPADMAALVGRTAQDGESAVEVAEALTAWAVEQGGHDNITVALARFDPTGVNLPEETDVVQSEGAAV